MFKPRPLPNKSLTTPATVATSEYVATVATLGVRIPETRRLQFMRGARIRTVDGRTGSVWETYQGGVVGIKWDDVEGLVEFLDSENLQRLLQNVGAEAPLGQ